MEKTAPEAWPCTSTQKTHPSHSLSGWWRWKGLGSVRTSASVRGDEAASTLWQCGDSTKALRSLLDKEASLGAQGRVETFTLVQSNQEFPQHTKAKPETRTSAFSGQNKVNSFFSCWRGVRKKANYNRILRSRVSHANIPQVQRQWKITIWISNTDVFGY